MAFLLDQLTLNRTSDYTYNLSGVYNVGGTNPKDITTLLDISDLSNGNVVFPIIDTVIDTYDPNVDKLVFNSIGIDFSLILHSFDRMLNIILDHRATGSRNLVVNHVAINDTKYPPPYTTHAAEYASRMKALIAPGDHKTFTENFKIKQIEITRQATDLFNVELTLSDHDSNADYDWNGEDIIDDQYNMANGIPLSAIVLNVQSKANSTNPDVQFKLKDVDFHKYYPNGLAILIANKTKTEMTTYWKEIEYKKGVLAFY